MVDTYTKFVLTVIAGALVALVMRPAFQAQPASAMNGCGDPNRPCYVATKALNAIEVRVTNFPSR